MAGIELVTIGTGTTVEDLGCELQWNAAHHHMAGG